MQIYTGIVMYYTFESNDDSNLKTGLSAAEMARCALRERGGRIKSPKLYENRFRELTN
jgi:hypothetical protein